MEPVLPVSHINFKFFFIAPLLRNGHFPRNFARDVLFFEQINIRHMLSYAIIVAATGIAPAGK